MAGSYVPRLLEGPPSAEGKDYVEWRDGNVSVFYPAKLRPKIDGDLIRISLKKFIFVSWLELEGARSFVCAPAEESPAA